MQKKKSRHEELLDNQLITVLMIITKTAPPAMTPISAPFTAVLVAVETSFFSFCLTCEAVVLRKEAKREENNHLLFNILCIGSL